jgi:hypothetical protein
MKVEACMNTDNPDRLAGATDPGCGSNDEGDRRRVSPGWRK